jgi:hypothetical protein
LNDIVAITILPTELILFIRRRLLSTAVEASLLFPLAGGRLPISGA